MKVQQLQWTHKNGWESDQEKPEVVQLALVFGARSVLEEKTALQAFMDSHSPKHLAACSTAGEIFGDEVEDDTLTAVAIQFEKAEILSSEIDVTECDNYKVCGEKLAQSFPAEGLRHLFVLSDGHQVNGTHLLEGIANAIPETVSVTGGMAGDGANFEKTVVGLNAHPEPGKIVAIAFYGDDLKIGFGSQGGWDAFGPERLITRSDDNLLYELDGKSALDLYKKYLGPQADELPSSALYFPLSIREPEEDEVLVRTILSINEDTQAMVFAGNMPQGSYARFMKANFERLIDGAAGAAEQTHQSLRNSEPELAILISCVGRKLILGQRIEEEVESVMETLGGSPAITGFYSYGEIAPFNDEVKCELHNQTMTITTFSEK